jgi:hypothetical protein
MRLTLLPLGLAIPPAMFLLVYPVYSGFAGTRPTRPTLLEVSGPSAIVFPHRRHKDHRGGRARRVRGNVSETTAKRILQSHHFFSIFE